MTDLILPRRQFLKTLSVNIAAPAIVRADNIMKVVVPRFPRTTLRTSLPPISWGQINDWQYIVRLSNILEELPLPPRRRWQVDHMSIDA